MGKQASMAVTGGYASEQHNRDKKYRDTLSHISPSGEIVVYGGSQESYADQINAIMRPYLEQYNAKQTACNEARQAECAAKGKKVKYQLKLKSLDYYNTVIQKTKKDPMDNSRKFRNPVRSLIITFGNVVDRVMDVISDQDAKLIAQDTVKGFSKAFPGFHVLQGTLHTDEAGAFHLHLDFFVAAVKKKWEYGIPVYTSFDNAMTAMNYGKEACRYPGKEMTAATLFHAYRNCVMDIVKAAMEKQGIELLYGVMLLNCPWLDPSTKRPQSLYKETVSCMNELKRYRAEMINILDRPDMKPENLKSALKILSQIQDLASASTDTQQAARILGYEITHELLERYIESCGVVGKSLYKQLSAIQDSVESLVQELDLTKRECYSLHSQMDQRVMEANRLERKIHQLEKQIGGLMTELEIQQMDDPGAVKLHALTAKKYKRLKESAKMRAEYEKLYQEALNQNDKLMAEYTDAQRREMEYQMLLMKYFGQAADQMINQVYSNASIPYEFRKAELDKARAENNKSGIDAVFARLENVRDDMDRIQRVLGEVDQALDCEK